MVKKAIIPAAGAGTRLQPITYAIPKELVRVGRKPCIHHVIDVLRESGVEEVLIVVGQKKGALMDYIGSGERLGIDAYYTVQDELKGLGDAILQGRSWVDGEDFAVIYGDNYIRPKTVLQDAIQLHTEKDSDATLVLHPVDDPTRFGIVKINGEGEVEGMIEKPSLEEAQNYKTGDEFLNIAGLGVYSSAVFDYLERTEPGKDNEIQFTDAIELMRSEGHPAYGFVSRGTRYDIGTWESLEEADRKHVENHIKD